MYFWVPGHSQKKEFASGILNFGFKLMSLSQCGNPLHNTLSNCENAGVKKSYLIFWQLELIWMSQSTKTVTQIPLSTAWRRRGQVVVAVGRMCNTGGDNSSMEPHHHQHTSSRWYWMPYILPIHMQESFTTRLHVTMSLKNGKSADHVNLPGTLKHRAFMASGSQYGRPASWPQPGIRSQFPPFGPFEWMLRHCPEQLLLSCSTQVAFAVSDAVLVWFLIVEDEFRVPVTKFARQPTHWSVNDVVDDALTETLSHLASVEETVVVPVPTPTNDALHIALVIPPVNLETCQYLSRWQVAAVLRTV